MSETSGRPALLTSDIRVWDPLLRLSHWSFPVLIAAMWWTAENDKWGLHKRLGLVLLGVLVFRFVWGFIGPETARFSQFVKGPRAVLDYWQGGASPGPGAIGHSPIGGWSTLALLGAMLVQVGLGLFAGDPYDGMTGPLNPLVGVMLADAITEVHEAFFNVLAGLIVLHLAAICWYAAKGNDLLSPMVGGTRPPLAGVSGIGPMPWGRGLLAIALAAGFAMWIVYGAPPLT